MYLAYTVEPLLSGQPLLSGHLTFPRGWPLNRGSTVLYHRALSHWPEANDLRTVCEVNNNRICIQTTSITKAGERVNK